MTTAAEALEACVARGRARIICQDAIASQMVGGVYCDGAIVIDERGKRCVPRSEIERVNAARAASPLPSNEPPLSPWLVGGLVALSVVAIVWVARS